MRKLLLTATAIATLSLNAYSQYGHGHVDFSSLPIKVEAGMMIPHNNTYTISSDFYGASFDTESGYFDTKIKDILDNPKPIAYLGIGADLPGKNRFITNGIMLRVGYENYEYTVLGEKHPFAQDVYSVSDYRYHYNVSRIHFNLSYFVSLQLFKNNLQIGVGAGILPTIPVGTKPQANNGLETDFMDHFSFGFNPEAKVTVYIKDFYVTASYSLVRTITDSYFGVNDGFGIKQNYDVISFGVGYHFYRNKE